VLDHVDAEDGIERRGRERNRAAVIGEELDAGKVLVADEFLSVFELRPVDVEADHVGTEFANAEAQSTAEHPKSSTRVPCQAVVMAENRSTNRPPFRRPYSTDSRMIVAWSPAPNTVRRCSASACPPGNSR
jgi:hypothetical protein